MSATVTSAFTTASATPTSGVDDNNQYNYDPTKWICTLFVVLFGISLAGHTFAMVRHRLWWLLPTAVLGCFGETLGWTGRLWSAYNVDARDPFMIQIVCTIIAPTPFVAAVFITFGQLVRRLGERYSWISAATYAKLFLGVDIASLVIQAAGGGIASSSDTDSDAKLGGNIMLAGIIIQMIALFIFGILVAQFFYNFSTNRPVRDKDTGYDNNTLVQDVYVWNSKLKTLYATIVFVTFVLMIRAVYRTIELADGWNGKVISTQRWFNIFDGAMVVLAVYAFLIFHPGRLMYSQQPSVEVITVAGGVKEAKRSGVSVV